MISHTTPRLIKIIDGIVNDLYQAFTPEVIARLELKLKQDPDATWNENRLADILPFVKAVPGLRIGMEQSLFGLSIISLPLGYSNESELVRYGLEPLIDAQLITQEDRYCSMVCV